MGNGWRGETGDQGVTWRKGPYGRGQELSWGCGDGEAGRVGRKMGLGTDGCGREWGKQHMGCNPVTGLVVETLEDGKQGGRVALGEDAELRVAVKKRVRAQGGVSRGNNGLRRVVGTTEVHGKRSSGSRALARELQRLTGNVVSFKGYYPVIWST